MCIRLDNVPAVSGEVVDEVGAISIAEQRNDEGRSERPLIKGRLKVNDNVYWSNRSIVTGAQPTTYKDRIDPYTVECLYVDGKEVEATAEDVLAFQRDHLEQKRMRRENNANLKQTKQANKRALTSIRQRM